MPRFTPMGQGVLSAEERHPLMSDTGRRALTALLEAPDGPVWNHQCGDRLDAGGLRRVEAFAWSIVTEPPRWAPGETPGWVEGFVNHARRVVPLHRRAPATSTTSRADLARTWWELVPDDADLDDLIWFPTSGTGQPPVVVPTHPVTVSCYYPLLLEAARWHSVASVRFRDDRADWITVVSQRHGGFTVPSWSSVLGCATAKVNLDPSGWRNADDRRRFLVRHDPQVITGDPVSLSHLADLDVTLHPAVLISTALHLAAATRIRLEDRFGCPVVDVYSTTETGPIAASLPGDDRRMALLQPRLFVEIVDGVVTVTGGINPYLPLLRYRTGDTGRLVWTGGQPRLEGLTGRAAIMLRSATGEPVASLDVTQLFEELPLRRWAVHQRADASVVVAVEPEAGAPDLDDRVTGALRTALGPVSVRVEPLTAPDKVAPFTVDAPG